MNHIETLKRLAEKLLEKQKFLEDWEKKLEDREHTLRRSYLEVKKLTENVKRKTKE